MSQFDDLFDNEMVRAAASSMSLEDKHKYMMMGEKIFNTIDFDTGKIITDDDKHDLICFEIVENLKSGYHPKFLSESEINTLFYSMGDDWFTKLGFELEDLPDFVIQRFAEIEKLKNGDSNKNKKRKRNNKFHK